MTYSTNVFVCRKFHKFWKEKKKKMTDFAVLRVRSAQMAQPPFRLTVKRPRSGVSFLFGPEDQRTPEPEDLRTRRPEEKRTEDQKTRGLEDLNGPQRGSDFWKFCLTSTHTSFIPPTSSPVAMQSASEFPTAATSR